MGICLGRNHFRECRRYHKLERSLKKVKRIGSWDSDFHPFDFNEKKSLENFQQLVSHLMFHNFYFRLLWVIFRSSGCCSCRTFPRKGCPELLVYVASSSRISWLHLCLCSKWLAGCSSRGIERAEATMAHRKDGRVHRLDELQSSSMHNCNCRPFWYFWSFGNLTKNFDVLSLSDEFAMRNE